MHNNIRAVVQGNITNALLRKICSVAQIQLDNGNDATSMFSFFNIFNKNGHVIKRIVKWKSLLVKYSDEGGGGRWVTGGWLGGIAVGLCVDGMGMVGGLGALVVLVSFLGFVFRYLPLHLLGVVKVQYNAGYNVFAIERQHSEQPESISNTCVVEKVDSNVIPDSPDMCENDIQTDQNAVECDDERVALANLIANLKLNVDENKKIQKQLKKANTSLAYELKECKSILAKTSRTPG
ncbi:hypothetical protein Tco_1016925 [Tanacetum coccineum]|uniref:Uncharacterized protein n=1 Tax=Tanacetum coccineum TaxID=301880 RepID=A0ABQ5FR79_9ASTR